MASTITIDPVTRIEGHLKLEVTVDTVQGEKQVTDARSSGTMFRGFEMILNDHDPLDAPMITQRICGVCPVSHAMASCMNLESAFGVTPPDNGRILRNLVLGANFIQSHVLHFYHLAALDFIDTTGILDVAPWAPRWITSDMITGSTAQSLVAHYVEALAIRRKAHQMGAIFGGKLPATASFVPGGCTETITQDKVDDFRLLLTEIRSFIDTKFIPDVNALGSLAQFQPYYQIGSGCGNLIAYGVFDLNSSGSTKLFPRGRITNQSPETVEEAQITEYVNYSYYTDACNNLNPATGETIPQADKPQGYSWVKAPRYLDTAHEAGPLARMWIKGEYTNGMSVLDRLIARALETKLIADTMDSWLNELVSGNPSYTYQATPAVVSGIGLTEAPRGALGHWIDINSEKKISRYQVITPTAWNASPRIGDAPHQLGPIEQALIGTPVMDENKPVELLRVVHSFDPCLACSVHLVRPHGKTEPVYIPLHAG